MEIITAAGRAVAETDAPEHPAFLFVLTHGAGGGVASKDIMAASKAGLETGAVVVRVTQPYRVGGARAPGSAQRQDAAWLEIIRALSDEYPGLPLVQGGRSNGARLACRTAQPAAAAAVIALAFPLHPPGKADDPGRSRAGELRAAGVPVLVINGDRCRQAHRPARRDARPVAPSSGYYDGRGFLAGTGHQPGPRARLSSRLRPR